MLCKIDDTTYTLWLYSSRPIIDFFAFILTHYACLFPLCLRVADAVLLFRFWLFQLSKKAGPERLSLKLIKYIT